MIWLHLAHLRAHQNDDMEFSANAAKLDHTKWPWPVISLLLGSSDPQTVHRNAQEGDSPRARVEHKCETDFYVGVYDLHREAKDEALKLLHAAAIGCPQDYLEYAAAKLELLQLGDTAR